MNYTFLDSKALLRKYDLRPRKSLGQNFLVDPSGLRKVMEAAQVGATDEVLEIGAGLGSLTVLLAQTAAAVKAVEVDGNLIAPLHEALAAGRIVWVSPSGLAADSLGASQVGERMFPIAQRHVAQSVLVDDDAIRRAQRWLWRELRLAVEPGGAAAFAALLDGAWQPEGAARVGVLVCGANVDPATLSDAAPDR